LKADEQKPLLLFPDLDQPRPLRHQCRHATRAGLFESPLSRAPGIA
jgi:hypothetical protein